jgi:hypothetical protein
VLAAAVAAYLVIVQLIKRAIVERVFANGEPMTTTAPAAARADTA